jgi:hypothetical protein
MKSLASAAILIATCLIAAISGQGTTQPVTTGGSAGPATPQTYPLCLLSNETRETDFHEMQHLWEDHILYTRLAVEYTIYNNSFLNLTTTRLLENQRDLGDIFALFYGPQLGDRLADILTRHIQAVVAFLTSILEGTDTAAPQQVAFGNAQEFAALWHEVNPDHIDQQVLYGHMTEHITDLESLMHAIINDNATEVVSAMNAYTLATRAMADYLESNTRLQHDTCHQ